MEFYGEAVNDCEALNSVMKKSCHFRINNNGIGKGLNFTNNDCETLNSVMKRDDKFKLITIALEKV